MFDHILSMLNGEPMLAEPEDIQIAVGALLVEAARMDDRFDETERAAVQRILARRFDLSPEETARLLAGAERAAIESSQLFRFTQLVVERFDPRERIGLIEMMWEVAYADGVLDPDEDALLRRVAGLIYVSDQDRGAARKRALRRLGHDPD
ncbi:MAG TPA: TerB family tellurite resistance protein [Stellaceae bacterium]|nr:TerB family tellurite resistance protein [Stellaceae bacterium]